MSVIVLLLWLSATVEGCKNLQHKSSKSTIKQKLRDNNWWYEDSDWWNKVEFDLEYPTLYNYTVCENVTIETGRQLEVIDGRKENVKYILFLNSTIPTVPVGVFVSFSNATQLYLNSSKVESIHPGAFSGMVSLEELYLQDNRIEVLERGTLNYLLKLKILDLSRNALRVIESKSLLGLSNLRELYLEENQLTYKDFGSFGKFVHLKIANFSWNAFEYLDFSNFADFENFNTILLNNNKLTNITFTNKITTNILDVSHNNLIQLDFATLPRNISNLNFANNKIIIATNWTKLENIVTINLRRNKIAKIGDIVGYGVKNLDLSWNNIKFLRSPTFDKLESLVKLDLGHNIISKIDHEFFQYLAQLQSLHLNGNKIKHLPVGCLKNLSSLKFLNLSGNLLTDLEFGTFDGLDNLKELALDHNKISVIQENSFHVLGKVEWLLLENNLIRSLNVKDLLLHLSSLKTITLKNNNWSCNSLFQITKAFQDHNIDVPHGDADRTANIFGIACRNEDTQGNAIAWTEGANEIMTTTKSAHPHMNIKENSISDQLFQKDLKNLVFYKFFSDFFNSSFYKFVNKNLNRSSFARYLGFGVSHFPRSNNREKHQQLDAVEKAAMTGKYGYVENFVQQHQELLKQFQMLTNRIIGFVSIMITILLAIVLLLVFIFHKPIPRDNDIMNEPRGNCNFIRNDLELRGF